MVPRLNPRDRNWVIGLICITAVLTTLPYFVGFITSGETWRFSGFVFGVEDGNSYIAKMLRGSTGDWLFKTPYTAADQEGLLAYLPYILLGKLAAPPARHLQLVVMYHLYRLAGLTFLIWITYAFVRTFVRSRSLRQWGVILIIWGGGLGWALLGTDQAAWLDWIPLSFYSPETFGFLAVYGIPHLTFSRGFLLWGLLTVIQGKGARSGTAAGVLWLLMALFQPLNVIIAWAVSGVYGLFLLIRSLVSSGSENPEKGTSVRHQLISMFWAGGISLPVVLYYLLIYSTNLFGGWQEQNLAMSPGAVEYLLAYALMVPYIGWLIFKRKWNYSREEWLLICWAAALPVLINLPVNTQRRLADGAWAALVVLAVMAFDSPASSPNRAWRWGWLLSLPAALLLVSGGAANALNPQRPAFLPEREILAYQALGEQSSNDDVVLSAFSTGNALPAWAPVFVVLGHSVETLNYPATAEEVQAYYRGELSPMEQTAMLEKYSVDFVFWGPEEARLSGGGHHSMICLEKTYGVRYAIYRVDCKRNSTMGGTDNGQQ